VDALLLKYGYALLFLGVAAEGEAFLAAAALLVHRGYFRLPVVIAVAVAGNTVADLVYYLAARMRGRDWLERRYGGSRHYRRVVLAMQRHGRWMLLGSRFAFGFRMLIPAACGAVGMPPATFLPLVVLAGILWAVPVALLAYSAGVAIGSGSDLLGSDQNRRGLELVLKARVLGAMAAIVSATATNARIMRIDDRLGTIEPGKLADLIAVDGDPLTEPELFDDPSRVVLVVKNGMVMKNSLATDATSLAARATTVGGAGV